MRSDGGEEEGGEGVPAGGGFAGAEAGDVVAAGDGGMEAVDAAGEGEGVVEGFAVAAVDDAPGFALEGVVAGEHVQGEEGESKSRVIAAVAEKGLFYCLFQAGVDPGGDGDYLLAAQFDEFAEEVEVVVRFLLSGGVLEEGEGQGGIFKEEGEAGEVAVVAVAAEEG